MKKTIILTLGLFFGLIGLMSCGGGEGDGGADDAARRDSLRRDSLRRAQIADSVRLDSIRRAEEEANRRRNTNTASATNKTEEKPKIPETVKEVKEAPTSVGMKPAIKPVEETTTRLQGDKSNEGTRLQGDKLDGGGKVGGGRLKGKNK